MGRCSQPEPRGTRGTTSGHSVSGPPARSSSILYWKLVSCPCLHSLVVTSHGQVSTFNLAGNIGPSQEGGDGSSSGCAEEHDQLFLA